MEIDNIYGFNWPSTKAGAVAIANCSVRLNVTIATRLCDINGVWDDNIDVSNCESDAYSTISIRVHGLSMYKSYVYHTCIYKIKYW